MAKDAGQLRDDASAAAAAGKHKRALECYLELERLEPTDAQWPKRVAETYRRLGKMRDAVSAFERAADRYAQNGFLVQAIAVCKLILQIDPSHVDTQQRLAAINAAQGAGPTRIGTLSDNHPSLHENPAVALLRARSVTPDQARGRGRPSSAPPVVSFVEPARGPDLAEPSSSGSFSSSPFAAQPAGPGGYPPPAGYGGLGGPGGYPPSGQPGPSGYPPPVAPSAGGRYPAPAEPPPLPYARGPAQPPAAPPAGAPGYARTGSSSGVPVAHGGYQPPSQPIMIQRGQGLDSVPLGSVVAGAHQQRDDGSQPGIVIIPLDGEDDSAAIDVYIDEESSRASYSHGGYGSQGEAQGEAQGGYEAPGTQGRYGAQGGQAGHGGQGGHAGRGGYPAPGGRVARDSQASGLSDPAIELDLAELEAHELDGQDHGYDSSDIPLAQPRLAGAAARQALAATPLFAGLSEAQLEALISRIELMTLAPGQVLLREGELGDALYVISDGEVVVEAVGPPRVAPAVLSAGAFFGEVTLITDHPRMATVTAQTMVEALRIDRDALAFVVARHPEVVTALLRFVRDRLVERWMRTSPLCRPFEERQRREFAGRFRFLEIEAGSVVMAPGDQADGLYIVLAGLFEVHRDGALAAALGPGELIGETVLMTGEPLHSTVLAATKCLALWLPVEHFREVIMIHPHVLEYVGAQAERRRLQIY